MKRAWLMCSHTLFPLVKVIHWILRGVKVMKRTKVKKQKTPKKQGCSLFLLLMLLALAPVVLATVILSTTSLHLTRTNLEGSVQTTLHVTADNLAKYCKENEITAMNASGYYEYLDSLKEEDLEMAILADGIPATTSIKNENDYRIREIPMDQDLVSGGGTEGYYDKNVVIDGNAYYGYYIPIMNDGRITAVAFAAERKNDITDALWEIEVVFLICAVGMVLLFGAICFFLSRALSSRMKETGARVDALAEGDLSAKKESHSIVREIRNLLLNTSQMQRNLAQVIGGVQEISGELLNSVRQVAEGSNATMEQAEQISQAVDQLSAAAEEMAENVQNISDRMDEIGAAVNDISASAGQLQKDSEEMQDNSRKAGEGMEKILTGSSRSVESVDTITSKIHETNDYIEKIDEAVALIFSISGQTNLLSLNASIEAARAGEAGRGFAVVAEEIRKLSEQSAAGAEQIKELAQGIMEKSGETVEQADVVKDIIREEQDYIIATREQYQQLEQSIRHSAEEIRKIAGETRHLSQQKEDILGNIGSLSAISEENAANNQQVNANIDEILTQIQTVGANCDKMKQISGELENSVAYFHTEKEPAGK
ncbi:hypothetical protein DXC11_15320 [Firmicutes bacterium OM08-11AC]|jgi:methyl-accepting chemotaxis protein|nr:hypothetical protein DXC11_15320 [Firmicutes bacterium OM08-11AC]